LQLVGFVEKPKEFLASLHLYIQPSRYEGFCIAMHEAMQAGLPIIASKVGQMPYTVEAGSGWLVDPGDVPALADALADALSHPERLAAMGQAAKARVYPRYSSEAFKDAGESILQRLSERGII
jgi:glycosyltransferase involved in cell wall biosynthesis